MTHDRVHELVPLGYPDSGMPDGPGADDSFSRRPVAPMVTQMVRLMRLYRPDVVITYPPNGLSGHPDDVCTHDVVVAAHANVVAVGDPDPARTPRLYHIAMSVSRVREARAAVRVAFGDDAWAPPEGMAVDDASITTTIDVTAFWDAKLAALAAHASQADAVMLSTLFALGDGADPIARVEEYVRRYPVVEGAAREDDLFPGWPHSVD